MKTKKLRTLAATMVMALVMLAFASPAWADNLVVNSNGDNTSPGLCADTDCTLREAIQKSESTPDPDTISFAPGISGEISLGSALPRLDTNLSIKGPGARDLTIRRAAGTPGFRIFYVGGDGNLSLSGLTISDGRAPFGGAFYNSGTLNISETTVKGNTATDDGGTPYNNGGALYSDGGTVTVERSTISGNSASSSGGGLYLYSGTMTVKNSTVYGNTAGVSGGGAYALDGYVNGRTSLKFLNSTVTANDAAGGGGIAQTRNTTVSLGSTIVALNKARNTTPVHDVSGAFTSLGFNFIGDYTGSTGFPGRFDQTNESIDHPLSPESSGLQKDANGVPLLEDNGGPTDTVALIVGSRTVDAGAHCAESATDCVSTDQRGAARPFDDPSRRNQLGASDVGAYELQNYPQDGPTFTVSVGGDTAEGMCGARCTLRDAINAANAQAGANTIRFADAVRGELSLNSALPAITGEARIEGPGAKALTIRRASGAPNFRIFDVSSSVSAEPGVVISGLTISGGNAPNSDGGGIRNAGVLTVEKSAVTGNSAGGGDGGGIFNTGRLTLLESAVSGNTAVNRVGGGLASSGPLTVKNSTVAGNEAGSGAGIFSQRSDLTLVNSTVSANRSPGGSGGGVWSLNSQADVSGTIIAGNTADSSPDTQGGFVSGGFNLIGNPGSSTAFTAGIDKVGTAANPLDAKLSPLRDNGGPTPTLALLNGSPAIDAGRAFGLTTDQRGAGRPFDEPTVSNASDASDIGAYEARDLEQSGPTSTVTTISDNNDGVCGDRDCTLREAIQAANSSPGDDTIKFADGVRGEATLTSALPELSTNIKIEGPGAQALTVRRTPGASQYRIFAVTGGANVTLSGLKISDGAFSENKTGGGGIYNKDGNLTVERVVLSNNSTDWDGGALSNGGTLRVVDSTFTNNFAQFGGAALHNTGIATVTGSTISDNRALNLSGGIYNEQGTLTLANSTVANNTGSFGGGVFNAGTLRVRSATVSGNTASRDTGGGIASVRGTANVAGSIVAGNTGTGNPDVDGTFASGGFNLIGKSDGSGGFGKTGDQTGTVANPLDPKLGPLQDNGGPTKTMALLSGSRAIGAGDNSATDAAGLNLQTDQRGEGFPRRLGTHVDAGAYEAVSPETTPPTVSAAVSPEPNAGGWNVSDVTVTITANDEPGGSGVARVSYSAAGAETIPWRTVEGATTTLNVTAEGETKVSYSATDAAGNSAEREVVVKLDKTAPVVSTLTGPNGPTNDTSPTFEFSSAEADASFECRLDEAPFEACSPPKTYADVSQEGPHRFQVRATDRAGNTGQAASIDFTVDTTAPNVTLDSPKDGAKLTTLSPRISGTAGNTANDAPPIEITATRDDGQKFTGTTFINSNGTYSYASWSLPDGRSYTVQVAQTDRAGNTGRSNTVSFSIDATRPTVRITSAPSPTTTDPTPTFEFTASEDASFECRVAPASFAPCSSPFTAQEIPVGRHRFEVRATDRSGNVSIVVFWNFNVVAPPTDDSYATDEDSGLTVNAANGVLANDVPAVGSILRVAKHSNPEHGSLKVNQDGSFTYTPSQDFNGKDAFRYTAADGRTDSDWATVTIAIRPLNDRPAAEDGSFTMDEDAPPPAVDLGALVSDKETADDDLSYEIVSGPDPGQGTLSGTGRNLQFEPAANFNGTAAFSYKATDRGDPDACGAGGETCASAEQSDVKRVEIAVSPINDAPRFTTGQDQIVDEDSGTNEVPGWATGISPGPPNESDQTVNFRVVAGDKSLFSNQPEVSPGGNLTFTPAPNANGATTVMVVLNDDGGTPGLPSDDATSEQGSFRIEVRPVNDAPVAGDDSYIVAEDTPLVVPAPGVLRNDADVDGETPTATRHSGPLHGTLSLQPNGFFLYTPDKDFEGEDSFTYKATDGTAESNVATVKITVIPAAEPPTPNTPPTVKVLTPKPGAGLLDRTPTIGATVTDGETDLAGSNIRLWVDGRRVTGFSYDPTDDGLAYTTGKLGPGRHTVLIVARDEAGLSASRFWGFRVVRR